MKLTFYLVTLLFLFITLSVTAQNKPDNHTVMCDHIHESDSENRQLVNGFSTGWIDPYVVDLATPNPYHFVYVTYYTGVDEIIIDHSFISQHTLAGAPITTLSLFDDGLGNDAVAGDNIFTSADIVYNNPNNYQDPRGIFMRFANVTYNFSSGTPQTSSIDLGFGVRYVNSNNMNTNIPIAGLGTDIQYSSHVVNIALGSGVTSPFSGLSTHTQEYYNYFPDTKDFMMFATSFATPNGPAASYSAIQREESGVIYNQGPFDNSATYGSAGELNGICRYFYTYGGAANLTNHELLHHWGTVLHPNLELTIPGSHWNLVEFEDSGFGSGWQRQDIITLGSDCYDVNNTNYTSRYNELEMYLMGLVPLSDVPWPLTSLADWTFNGWGDPCPFYTTTGTVTSTQADFSSLMGPRVPDHTTSQKDFESALIVLTERLMTPLEMSYFNWQMEQNEMLIGDPDRVTSWSEYNFNEATFGNGTLTTKLPCPLGSGGPNDLVITDNPIPSGLYQATNSLTSNTPTAANSNVHFQAGQVINLNDGFEVNTLSDFLAEIMGCGL